MLPCRQVFEELLWVWPATGPEEHIHAAAKRPDATAEIDGLPPGTEVHTVSKWFQASVENKLTKFGAMIMLNQNGLEVGFAE